MSALARILVCSSVCLLMSASWGAASTSTVVVDCWDGAAFVRCPWMGGEGIRLTSFSADVQIDGQVARTNLTLVFHNEDPEPQEAMFVVPLPPGATLTAFSLSVDGVLWEGRVDEKRQARAAYTEAQERGDDAVLLEMAQDEGLKLSVHTPAGKQRDLSVAYVALLDLEAGARAYRLDTSRLVAADQQIGSVDVDVHIVSGAGLSGVVFGGLPLTVQQQTPKEVRAFYSATDVETMDDIVAVWTEGSGAWRGGAWRSADAGDAGWLVAISPGADVVGAALPRDIVFVLDTSGSMKDEKIGQAIASLREVLLSLRPDDRFGLVTFSDAALLLTPELTTATSASVTQARQRLSEVTAQGSTNLDDGLQEALALLGDPRAGRVPIVVLLSDGMPTAGVQAPDQILARLTDANARRAAVHVLAIGLDADGSFLEDVAGRTGGTLTMLEPGARLQERLAGFYATLDDPLLADVSVTIEGVEAAFVYPAVLPPLYEDGTVRVLFRAPVPASGVLTVTLDGIGAEGRLRYGFTEDVTAMSVVPEVDTFWGAAHVAHLMSDQRIEGHDAAREDAIIEAAVRYGIVTPYTSWVITRPIVPEPTEPPGAAVGATHVLEQRAVVPTAPTEPTTPGGAGTGDADDAASEHGDGARTPGPSVALGLMAVAFVVGLLRHRFGPGARR